MLKKTYRFRLNLLYLLPIFFMPALIIRLYYVQIKERNIYEKEALIQHFSKQKLVPSRGKIVDRNNTELAGSVMLEHAYIEQRHLKDVKENTLPDLARDLDELLGGSQYNSIYSKLQLKDPKFPKRPSLAREVDEKQKGNFKNILLKYKDRGVPLTAISFDPEGSRQYSHGHIAPQVVGFTQRDTSGDNKGTIGVELFYNSILRGKEEEYKIRTSAVGLAMEPAAQEILESTYGHNIRLTIDENIQAVAQEALAQGVETVRGDKGVAVVYSVKTGELLAIANYPSFNLNMLKGSNQSLLRNSAISDEIEPGSVMKILTFLTLFDEGKAQTSELVDCNWGTYKMKNGRVIRDVSKRGVLPLNEAFQLSSNIATIKFASRLSAENYYHHLKSFGLGEKTGLDLPGEAPGKLRDYKKWDGYTMSSIPMGYELRITPIQAVAAVGAIGNGGWYMQPHIVKEITDQNGDVIEEIKPKKLRQIADPVACQKMLNLLEQVVEKGTGKTAKMDEYKVGGKTGTTKKIVNGVYANKYIASFCGLAPIENPEVCIYIYVDNPKTDAKHGGQVSGPIFREIARETLKILRVPVNNSQESQENVNLQIDNIRNRLNGKVPQEIFHEVNESESVAAGSMPNLTKLSLREALSRIAELNAKVDIKGSGIVIDQSPKPYETIEEGTIVKLVLGNDRQYVKSKINQLMVNEDLSDETSDSASIATADESTTQSVGLVLGSNEDSVSLEVTNSPMIQKPIKVIAGTDKLLLPETTQYPDNDPRANKTPNVQSAKKTWEKFEKEMKEKEKLRKEGKLDLKEDSTESYSAVTNPDIGNESSDDFYSVKPPEIDGSEDIDLDTESAQPIQINVKSKNSKPGVSLYNM